MAKRGFTGAMMRGFGARDHEVTVTGTEHLAPHFVRVRMTSPTLLRDAVVAPTAWLRFWFPDPDGGDTEHQRAYTLSEADEATGAFAVDVVLHEPAGPASAWVRRARPGTTVQATSLGSTRFDLPDELPAGYLLIGDSASMPAMNGILSTLPDDVPVELYLEEHDEADRLIPLVAHARANVHWVPRRGETSLAAAIEARDWSDWYVWAAPESGSLKHLRVRLRDEFGFPGVRRTRRRTGTTAGRSGRTGRRPCRRSWSRNRSPRPIPPSRPIRQRPRGLTAPRAPSRPCPPRHPHRRPHRAGRGARRPAGGSSRRCAGR